MIEAPELRLPGIRHGFFTRAGGVSEGLYASLNCGLGSGDRPEAVAENRTRALARLGLGGDALVTLHQVHSAEAVLVELPFAADRRPEADGMATTRRGLALGALAADCAPILLADAEAGIVGAAHAGWRGALAGIAEATVAAMERLGARRAAVVAAIGPCIRQRSYQVGPEFRAEFVAADAGNDRWFAPSREPGRWQFDLAGYIAARLERLGLGVVAVLPLDTCADETRFFSYRRACRKGEGDYGRLLSAIALEP